MHHLPHYHHHPHHHHHHPHQQQQQLLLLYPYRFTLKKIKTGKYGNGTPVTVVGLNPKIT